MIYLGKRLALDQVAALARSLQASDANVVYAESDRIMVHQLTPNDPRYPEQWQYFDSNGGLRADLAWDSVTGSGVTMAVIDTGYRPHADLAGQFVQGYDFITDTAIAADGVAVTRTPATRATRPFSVSAVSGYRGRTLAGMALTWQARLRPGPTALV